MTVVSIGSFMIIVLVYHAELAESLAEACQPPRVVESALRNRRLLAGLIWEVRSARCAEQKRNIAVGASDVIQVIRAAEDMLEFVRNFDFVPKAVRVELTQ